MAARFMRRNDGDPLKRDHAMKILEELSRQVSAGAADIYQLQFTVDDNENLKGLLVFNLGTEWDTFETLHNMNKDYGLETQVVDIVDEAEVWAEGDIDLEGDDDFDEDEFRKLMKDISQQTDIERRKSILERRKSLQGTRKLTRRESIAFDEELKKLDDTLILREEDEDALINQPTEDETVAKKKQEEKKDKAKKKDSRDKMKETENKQDPGDKVEKTEERQDSGDRDAELEERTTKKTKKHSKGEDGKENDVKEGVDVKDGKVNKKKLDEVGGASDDGESTAKRQRKIGFAPQNEGMGDQQVPTGEYDITDGSVSMGEEGRAREDDAMNKSFDEGGEYEGGDDYDHENLPSNESLRKKKREPKRDQSFDALARPSDNEYLNTGKTFDRSQFEQRRRKSRLDVVADDEEEDLIFAVLRRMRASARKVVARQDHLGENLTEHRVLARSPYLNLE